METDDELIKKEAPPTKRQLSENKLFEQFGSLRIDARNFYQDEENPSNSSTKVPGNSDDDADNQSSEPNDPYTIARREFDRYVYLLFRDKTSNSPFPQQPRSSSNLLMDRIIRDEREKLSKAVILWSPPLKDSLQFDGGTSDDDEDFQYKDHRDFLKDPNSQAATTDDPMMMIEPSDADDGAESSSKSQLPSSPIDPDDVMLIE